MTEEEKKPQHCEKELAQFIRSGATRRPDQAFGDYYRGRSASCALGAAYEGMYRLPTQAERPPSDEGSRMVLRLPRRLGAQVPARQRLPEEAQPRRDHGAPERRP